MLKTVLKSDDVIGAKFIMAYTDQTIAQVTQCDTKESGARWQATIIFNNFKDHTINYQSLTKEAVLEAEAIEGVLVLLIQFLEKKYSHPIIGIIKNKAFTITDILSADSIFI